MAEPTPEQLAKATELAAKGQEALNKQIETYNKLLIESGKLLKENQNRLEKTKQLEDEINKLKDNERKLLKDRVAISERIAKITNEINEAVKAAEENSQDSLSLSEEELKLKNEELAKQQELLKGSENALNTMRDQTKELKSQKKLMEEVVELEKQYGDKVEENLKAAEKRKNSFTQMAKDYSKNIPVIGNKLSQFLEIQAKLPAQLGRVAAAGENLGGTLGTKIANGATKLIPVIEGLSLGFLAAAAAIVVTLGYAAKLALEIDNLSKSLAAATGFADNFGRSIKNMGMAGMMSGVGFKESAEALKSLTEGLSSFNPNAQATNEYVGLTVARLGKLGVSSASAVKSIDHMQRAMGMTAKEAADMTAQVARMGKEIGISGTKMIEQFNAASGRLAIYGKNNVKVFKELAAQAKATGIEINALLNVSKQFDQFDTAAESAAKLNAALGTQLGTIEMMNATDSERVMMIKQQVQMSVGNFDSLDKFTKQYIAQAMGLNDVAEAQRLLNMSTAEYQASMSKQKEQADIQAELAEATAAIVPMMDKLKIAASKLFMVFSPFIDFFSGLINGMDRAYTWISKFTGALDSASTFGNILWNVLKVIGIVLLALTAGLSWPVTGVLALVAAFGSLFDVLHWTGSPMLYEMPKYLAEAFKSMGQALLSPISLVQGLASSFGGLFSSLHPKETGMSFDVEALAKMDTSKVAAGFKEIKSALMDLSTLKVDGFLAMKTDGASSSFVMGSEGVIKSISEGKLTVDVKMPDMKMPDVHVKVYIGDKELRDIIRTEAKAVVARAG